MAVNGNCVVWAQNKSTVTLGSFRFCCDSSKQRPYTMHSQFFWSSKLKCGSHLTSTMPSFYTNNINVMWKPMWKNLNGKNTWTWNLILQHFMKQPNVRSTTLYLQPWHSISFQKLQPNYVTNSVTLFWLKRAFKCPLVQLCRRLL